MSGRFSDTSCSSGSAAFLAITFCWDMVGFAGSGAALVEAWLRAGSLRPLRLWVGPSLFDSSAKVGAAGLAFKASRFAGKLNSNFSFEELWSTFFGSTSFTSRKALLVKVCLSNHSGFVGMSSIFVTMIPPLSSFFLLLSSSALPFFSSSSTSFASLPADSFPILESDPFCLTLLVANLEWSSFGFCGSLSSSFWQIFGSTFSFNLLHDLPFLLFPFGCLSIDLTKGVLEKEDRELKTLKSLCQMAKRTKKLHF